MLWALAGFIAGAVEVLGDPFGRPPRMPLEATLVSCVAFAVWSLVLAAGLDGSKWRMGLITAAWLSGGVVTWSVGLEVVGTLSREAREPMILLAGEELGLRASLAPVYGWVVGALIGGALAGLGMALVLLQGSRMPARVGGTATLSLAVAMILGALSWLSLVLYYLASLPLLPEMRWLELGLAGAVVSCLAGEATTLVSRAVEHRLVRASSSEQEGHPAS